MIRRFFIVLTSVLLVLGVFWAGYCRSSALTPHASLSLGAITRVSPAGNGENIQQIWAAADSTDSRYLVVCGGDSYPLQNLTGGYVYASGDNGVSWNQAIHEQATKFISEESCTYGTDGRPYFAAGESDTSMGEPRHEWGHLHLFTSGDHGMNWNSLWKRKNGWMDWTSMAAVPATGNHPSSLVVFANSGTDKLGHWLPSRPVAIVSHNGGQTFSELLSPPQPPGLHYVAVWTSGSAVLPDGSALFATSAALARPKQQVHGWWSTGHLHVEVFAYSPSTGRVSSRAVIRSEKDKSVFTVAMAHDTGHGRFAGRLYVSWLEYRSLTYTGTLWLATSDDQGYHWNARPVSTEACLGDIKLAVAPDGTVGIIWSETNTRLRFAVSHDGGHTFSKGTTIAQHALGALKPSDAVSFNERWAAEGQAIRTGTEQHYTDFLDLKNLGLSIRLMQPVGISDYAVVADTKDVFHALWSQVEPDGTHALFTRTARATSNASRGSAIIGDVPAQCVGNALADFPKLGSMPTLRAPNGEREISNSLIMYVQNLQYNPVTHSMSVDITLKNKGKSTVRGALTLVGLAAHSDFGTPVAANATGKMQGQPYWDASRIIPAGGLQPGATSTPLSLRFTIEHFKAVPDATTGGDGVAMWVKIYQKP